MSETDIAKAAKVALVTGAGGGIGRAIVRHLSDAGYTIAACDRDKAAAEAAVEGRDAATAYEMDICDSAGVASTVDRINNDLGTISVLVNNAAIDKIEPFVESTEATWRAVVEVNYLGTVIVTRTVLDAMLAAGYGRIISISSDAGRVGSSGEVVYSGTKGAVIAFGKALAREVAAKGITVNTVCPGPTDTPLLKQVSDRSQALFDAMARAVPMKRIATPDDIAPAVVFFAGDGAGYITGQTLSVSGGLTMV